MTFVLPLALRLLSICALFSAVCAQAATSIDVPEFFELQSVNGQEQKSGLLQKSRSVPLQPGPVLIELRYTDVQPAELGDSHSNFRSASVAVRFQAEANHRYAVKAERPDSERAAIAFSAAPRLIVVDAQSGTAIEQQFFTAADLKMGKIAPVNKVSTAEAAPNGEQSLVAQNLWFWWQQADAVSRQHFLSRIGR